MLVKYIDIFSWHLDIMLLNIDILDKLYPTVTNVQDGRSFYHSFTLKSQIFAHQKLLQNFYGKKIF